LISNEKLKSCSLYALIKVVEASTFAVDCTHGT
jgi:hypothetical protein